MYGYNHQPSDFDQLDLINRKRRDPNLMIQTEEVHELTGEAEEADDDDEDDDRDDDAADDEEDEEEDHLRRLSPPIDGLGTPFSTLSSPFLHPSSPVSSVPTLLPFSPPSPSPSLLSNPLPASPTDSELPATGLFTSFVKFAQVKQANGDKKRVPQGPHAH